MTRGTLRRWYGMFKDWQTNVHEEEQSGQPVISKER
jgi:hypothetical protein